MKLTNRELMEKWIQLKTSLVLSHEDSKRRMSIEKVLNERLFAHKNKGDTASED